MYGNYEYGSIPYGDSFTAVIAIIVINKNDIAVIFVSSSKLNNFISERESSQFASERKQLIFKTER